MTSKNNTVRTILLIAISVLNRKKKKKRVIEQDPNDPVLFIRTVKDNLWTIHSILSMDRACFNSQLRLNSRLKLCSAKIEKCSYFVDINSYFIPVWLFVAAMFTGYSIGRSTKDGARYRSVIIAASVL